MYLAGFLAGMLGINETGKTQQWDTRFSASTAGGVVTNTYLTPALDEWGRSNAVGFYSLTPAFSVIRSSTDRQINLAASGQLFHPFDDRRAWTGGWINSSLNQPLSNRWVVNFTGGANLHRSDYTRNMQWARIQLSWTRSAFTRFSVNSGLHWRTYQFEEIESSRRFESIGFRAQHWLSPGWSVSGDLGTSWAHLQDPSEGFRIALQTTWHPATNWRISLSGSMQQFTQEFQLEGGTVEGQNILTQSQMGQGPPGQDDPEEVITHEIRDQFYQGALNVGYSLSDLFTLTARFAGLGWSSTTDDELQTDVEARIGVEISLRPDWFSGSSEVGNIEWINLEAEENSIIEVSYSGDGQLFITGDFNDWDEPGIPLRNISGDRYRAEIQLSAGYNDYKLRVRRNGEEEWLDLPESVTTVSDGFGGRNGRVYVELDR